MEIMILIARIIVLILSGMSSAGAAAAIVAGTVTGVGIVFAVVGAVYAASTLIDAGVKIYNNIKNGTNSGFNFIEEGFKKVMGDEAGEVAFGVTNLIALAVNLPSMAKGALKLGTGAINFFKEGEGIAEIGASISSMGGNQQGYTRIRGYWERMTEYTIYKNNSYRLGIVGDKFEIIDNSNESARYGFKELKFEQGFISKSIYVKEVSIDELDIIYTLEYKVIYRGKEFIPWAVGKFILETDKISLGTNDEKEARNYNFEKMEQFVFKKDVPIDEIDALIEIKKPILKFQDMEAEFTRIEQKDIRKYIYNLLE